MRAIILIGLLHLLIDDPPPCHITLSKTPAQPTYSYAGQRIRYDYVFTNTGTFPLQGPFWIEDSRTLPRYPAPLPEWWMPGQVLRAFSEYDITEGDMLRQDLSNAAWVEHICRSNLAWAIVRNDGPIYRQLFPLIYIRTHNEVIQ